MSGNDSSRNIIIVGFMGTGKSTVSRLLAERLGWESKDTDEEIERLAGRSIKEMFSEDGEEVFRDWESKVLADVLGRGRQVVATGGGAVLREVNRRAMLSGGWVIALTADKQSLIRRVTSAAAAGTRPLLAGDAEERVTALLETRRHAYDFAHVSVDTTQRSPSEVTELLIRWLPQPKS
ncbi:shikimate kinase [Cohnella silvisoli]|uniref:Shikimate kinase n=1 Tax=Cohnella silvisoli TaxID=2873699 RepID=A0ABV1KZ44_9BACL|nr:shikimate kinase [Cohnella silvisoli]